MHLFVDGLVQAGCEIVSIDSAEGCTDPRADVLLLHWA